MLSIRFWESMELDKGGVVWVFIDILLWGGVLWEYPRAEASCWFWRISVNKSRTRWQVAISIGIGSIDVLFNVLGREWWEGKLISLSIKDRSSLIKVVDVEASAVLGAEK